ncbi:MAG: PRC-barrel domain-containing protein [Syntrophomonas sp.]|uniref:PRC-barrel domain-containing protein n=1 Tax=Syntrophomonas sp. TaxID=2053627 RepID=UPI0026271238|nr:PRC-barrel domain-containing protein [Syntrophomonas sp.]MDD2510593.1 PRC-barrel domain-containing protein [Syntrophomonas sp.]MDD3878697.1 PRC-barrel domain-containing protein [Syntrophomonas sp.]MDD4626167.1 PRC-barrel domain-containing protein [Syntrophomonas sp.]
MKTRNIQYLPVFLAPQAEVVAVVQKAVIGDDLGLLYLVVRGEDGKDGLIFRDDFDLTPEAVKIWDLNCIKSYAHGEELSVYEKKLGDTVFDWQGKELGIVSDFILSPAEKQVQGLEISSGAINDILQGRMELSLQEVSWKSVKSGVLAAEGSQEE